MVLIISDKKKEFEVAQIGNILNELNNFYIKEVFAYQNDNADYQNILTRFSSLLDNLYQIIKDMECYNNCNNKNNNN